MLVLRILKLITPMHARQVTFLIIFCSSVMAFAQKAYLSVTVNPIDAITESTLTQARVSLLSTIDSTEVDTFRRITILGDVIKRYTYVYDNSHATLPFKRIVRVESEGYETLYYDLNMLPSEAKHGEVAYNIGVIRLHRERKRNLGRFYKFNLSLANSQNLIKATANVILLSQI